MSEIDAKVTSDFFNATSGFSDFIESYDDSNVIYFELVNGRELMGVPCSSVSKGHIEFENLATVQIVQNPANGQIGLQMMPYPILSDHNMKVRIDKNSIVLVAKPSDELLNNYRERFGKVQVIKNPGILLNS